MKEATGAGLEIDSLRRDFGRREIVHELSLRLGKGERAALSGPNGSGKTTVLRCIAGTLSPTSGSIAVGPHQAGSMQARRLVGASFSQERSFYFRLTGRANLLFFAQLRHGNRRKAAEDVAEVIEELAVEAIAAERADKCSSGMIQQLALARALLGRPKILLLDEPTRSLDKEAQARLWSAIDGRPELTVVAASHLEEDIERCGIRIDFPT